MTSFTVFAKPPAKEAHADWKFVEKRLNKAGFTKRFIKALHENYETRHFSETIELNLLLFLKKTDYHGPQVDKKAVKDVRDFMSKHYASLLKTQKDHGVNASVISSLMWLESRFGRNTGYFHVPSVYAHLLQVERSDVLKHLHNHAKVMSKNVTKGVRAEITKRTKKKAAWALEELRALQTMFKRDRNVIKTLRGSFAGAFGIPQFIPSSYVRWARPFSGKVARLHEPKDAIYSVGYYLKDNGWRPHVVDSHFKALLKYNNSTDYANAILNLAKEVDKLPHRQPSGVEALN